MRRVLLAFVAVAVLAAGSAAGWLYLQLDAPGPLPAATAIVVPHGRLEDIAAALAQTRVLTRPLAFRALALATSRNGALHAGEFQFPEAASIRQVLTVCGPPARCSTA